MPRADYDAIVIGVGAAGAVFVAELVKAGRSVLAVEYGPRYTNHREQFVENELAMWPLIWDSSGYEVFGDYKGTPNLGVGVGGGTLAWTAVSLRLFSHDFQFKRLFGTPSGTSVADWPFPASRLNSYYTLAEQQMGVSGAQTPWDCGPEHHLAPPLPLYDGSLRLAEGMSRLGLRSSAGRIATNSRPVGERSACLNCGFCRSGCRVDAKYQSDRVLVEPSLGTGRLTLLSETEVTRLAASSNGERVEGVEYVNRRTGARGSATARVVIACNNPIEIPRLFLNSTSPAWPNGLGNRYDQIGRHFFCHLGSIGMGTTDVQLRSSVGHNMGNLMCLDYALPTPGRAFRGGFSLLALNGAGAGVLAVDPLRALYGLSLKNAMRGYNRSMFMVSFIEGFPSADSRISLSQGAPDALGLRRARIDYHFKSSELELYRAANAAMQRVLEAAGAQDVHLTPAPFEAHPMGSMRMGRDARSSATDQFGRVHGLRNAYVGGAALFPTGGAANPTLTIHALALQTAERIVAQLRGGDL
jgi:choline dehydrogenase-like flavoprotein